MVFFPPITRDAKLIGADPLHALWSPHAQLFFGLYPKAALLERGNFIFWTWSRKTENWVTSGRVMISGFVFVFSFFSPLWYLCCLFLHFKCAFYLSFQLGWSHTRSMDLMQVGRCKSITLSEWCEGCSPNCFPFESSGAAVLKDYLPSFLICGDKCTLAWHSLTVGKVYGTDFFSHLFFYAWAKVEVNKSLLN